MAADPSYWMAIAGDSVLVFLFAVVALVVCAVFIYVCTIPFRARWRLSRLGGVTTLTQTLNYNCSLCQDSMEAGEKVRTLSCDHAFHCGATPKCENGIDQWLRTGPMTPCPICRQVPHRVLPGKQPPPSSPAPSTPASASTSARDLVEPLLPPAHDETLPGASSSAPAPPLAQSPRDLVEPLLPPAHDETLPEASSSAPAPPPAQSPRGLEEELPLPACDETLPEEEEEELLFPAHWFDEALPEASSSQ